MAGTTLCKFVDSIAAAPTVRFDFNGGIVDLQRVGTVIEMPPLRSAWADNAMSDGGLQSSSAYGLRTIRLHALISGDADTVATSLQTLFRECNREDNYLLWHPRGASKPVFFKTFRAAPEALEMTEQSVGVWRVRCAMQAEPFALGLRETLGPFTVNNDPAAGSNGLFFDVTGVIGDVAADVVLIDRTATRSLAYLAVRQHGNPNGFNFWMQAESMSAVGGTDTTNPGGGPDAVMSGTGTNNFMRTTFATLATMAGRLVGTPLANTADDRGRFRLIAVVRRSDATSDMQIQGALGPVTGAVLTIPKTTARQAIDLGLFSPDYSIPDRLGGYAPLSRGSSAGINLSAARSSGTGTLDWDFIALIPCDEATLIYANGTTADDTTPDGVIDGGQTAYFSITSGADPWATGPSGLPLADSLAGSCPQLVPNQTNRFYSLFMTAQSGYMGMTKTASASIEVHYWPRYLFIRPSAT